MSVHDEQIDIINEQNEVLGTIGKSIAHKEGTLHRIVIGELAKRAGTGQAVISRLEGGNAKPSFSLVQKMATALKTDLTFTFTAN